MRHTMNRNTSNLAVKSPSMGETSTPVPTGDNEVYYLEGLTCANCAAKIETSLTNNPSFKTVNFSFATKKLVVENASENVDAMTVIMNTVDSIEDGVTVVPENHEVKEYVDGGDETIASKTKLFKEIILAHWITLLGVLSLGLTMAFLQDTSFGIAGYILAYVLIGGDVAYRAVKNILKGELFDENFLMTIATIGAFALGEYVEAVAVMLFYKVGEGFQDYAVDYTRRSIKSLINIKADYANLVEGSTTKKVDPGALAIDDIIVIKPGEKIPVDAVVVKGSTTVDTSALTGESLPVTMGIGDTLLSGAINIDASITAKVSKKFKDSTVARILDMVENATSKKAKTEQFITKFAKVYTPVVVASAVLLAVLPPLLGFGAFSEWISRALIFLVISCPCALVLSVPLGYFGGLGAASREGILVKGGNYLEALNSIDTFVFDKTGTLTKGNFVVVDTTNDEALALASVIEVHSNHPIAKSIVHAYGKAVDMSDVEDVAEVPGEGMTGQYRGKALAVGNARLMERIHADYDRSDFIGSAVHVAYDNTYVGTIYIADEIKERAPELVQTIQSESGKEVVMLTGDQQRIAKVVSDKLGIKKVFSQLLPGDKLTHLEALIDDGKKVLFVGDGINDAPVLARADIGVAMGGVGSDAAVEAADMVIMNDDPSKIITGIQIAKKTRNIVMQNIIFAIGVKVFFLALGAAGEANMYEAIFADVGVALIAVLNSMRTLRIRG